MGKDRWTPAISRPPQRALIVGTCSTRIWGLPAGERLRRQLTRAGIGSLPDESSTAIGADERVLLVRCDYVFEEGMLRGLIDAPDTLVVVADDTGKLIPVAAHAEGAAAGFALELLRRPNMFRSEDGPTGLSPRGPEELVPTYNRFLRKRAQPYALRLTPETRRAIEWRTFRSAYKGATDFVTKTLWPLPAFHVTRWCAARKLTPNMVTTASLVLCIVAGVLFGQGLFLAGCAVAWAMTFLDTVDGKLARCTLTSSDWGDTYDHGIDLLHPPVWWWAWWVGLAAAGIPRDQPLLGALWVILIGYVIGRIIEGTFRKMFGLSPHVWTRIDYRFRAVTARRNPNLALLTLGAVSGHPDQAFIAVAVWTVVSLLFHSVRWVQAAREWQEGRPLRSYLDRDDSLPTPDGSCSAKA